MTKILQTYFVPKTIYNKKKKKYFTQENTVYIFVETKRNRKLHSISTEMNGNVPTKFLQRISFEFSHFRYDTVARPMLPYIVVYS